METMRNKVISGIFLLFIGTMSILIRADEQLLKMFKIATAQSTYLGSEKQVKKNVSNDKAILTMNNVSEDLVNKLSFKNELIELSGAVIKSAGVQSYYNNVNGINITNQGYNVGCYQQTTTDYEVEQMVRFKGYLDTKGIQLLYVSEPAKYIHDEFFQKEFGGESYLNRNTDLFLTRIEEAGIEYIDLRDNIKKEELDSLKMFYRTDHHWTVPASKWAAEIIAERLNVMYSYNIDLSLYDDDKFNNVQYKNAWLGEQGKKVGKSYMGLDDYTMLEPLYETNYTISGLEGVNNGDFSLFIDKEVYSAETEPYDALSWHYSYKDQSNHIVKNNMAPYGKILLLGDSYEASMLPFLSLGINEINMIIPRNLGEKSIRTIVEEGNYDTVIIAYTQFMIGAHDNEASANYRMFTFE